MLRAALTHIPRDLPYSLRRQIRIEPAAFGEDLVFNDAARLWYATLGQFSLIRLERDSQLVIPVYNYSVPENECAGTSDDDPCSLFGRIRFPVEEFYPPDSLEPSNTYRGLMQ